MNIRRTGLKEMGRRAPSLKVLEEDLVVSGKWLKFASLLSETWRESLPDQAYERLVLSMSGKDSPADVFTFTQKVPKVKPIHPYPFKWENAAVIPLLGFEHWIRSLSTDMRKDLKRAKNRGVVTSVVTLNEELINGIIEIHNDTPTRQGRPFRHFGKDFDTVKRDYSTFPERSEFIAAYYGTELIGILKIIHVAELACIMQILSKTSHYDKRPTNALIAKSVEACMSGQKAYLTYGQMYYGKQTRTSLADFKIRNGFECVHYPRYYVPLTFKGKWAVSWNLLEGIKGILPRALVSQFVELRSALLGKRPSHDRRAQEQDSRISSGAKDGNSSRRG